MILLADCLELLSDNAIGARRALQTTASPISRKKGD